MNIDEFAVACSTIETFALNNQLLLKHYGTSRDDVQEVVNMARDEWFRKNGKRKESKDGR
jgi:hypothetical protein